MIDKIEPDYKEVRKSLYFIIHKLDKMLYLCDLEGCKAIEFSMNDAKEMIETGEEFIAFENLCSNLYEVNFPLTSKLYEQIDALGRLWDIDDSSWNYLRNCIKD